MRAWQVCKNGEPEVALQLLEVDPPQPGRDEVQIRVETVALALPDVFLCRGVYPLTPKKMPFTPGQEVVGVVTAAGEGVDIPVGTRVMSITQFATGNGGFAEFALGNGRRVFPLPDEINAVDGATISIAYGTAYLGLIRRGQLKTGETLLVHGGSGGVGSAVIQLGRHHGARVLATEVGPKKVEACRKLGAEMAIDTLSNDFVEIVNNATGGRGANLIYDPVGGDVFTRSLDCIANEGRIVIIGYASGQWANAPCQRVVLKNISIVGVFMGAYSRGRVIPVFEDLLKLFAEKHISAPVERVISFEEIPQGLTDIANQTVVGRIVAKL